MAILTRRAPYHRVRDDKTIIEGEYTAGIAERVVWLIGGTLITLLAFRFIFALLGANPANDIVNFVYDVSNPFVAPFFNMFNYNYVDDGIGRFEVFTLVAIAVYGILTALIARILNLLRL